MFLPWIVSAIIAVQPVQAPDSLSIMKDGHEITHINRLDFTFPYTDLPILDSKKYQQFLDKLNQQFSVAPQNARLAPNGSILPEKVGSQLHRAHFTEQFYSYFFSKTETSLDLPMQPVYPKVDSELLAHIRTHRIGRYVTSFQSGNKRRSNNIQLATEAINNSVIFPKETFSFNHVVGMRTASKGYVRAPVIIRGEYSEDIGGGICQVSSTLFNAVDNAGLEIIQRFSHSRPVPYIPPGRDATVSWYGPDFQFKNQYNQPVLILAKTFGNYLVITLYSSETIEFTPRKVPYAP